ncbi:MAG: FAD-dependent oxidoreductase [Blastocatellia bacterium]|nr:FAD-dependent oxidoreductase [Blastocatellia bacterium]
MKYDFDMIVIGGGAAGLTASGMSASFGAKTALVEAKRLGGDCTWYGCVPSKTLLKAAKVAHLFRSAAKYGLQNQQPEFDFARVMEHVHRTQEHIYRDADAPENFENLGVKVIAARAHFLDKHTVQITYVGGKTSQVTSRYFIIATGSSPIVPPIEGVSETNYLTNESIFSITELPKRLIVVGSGPIGTEMSQAFRRFGSDVVVIDVADKILPKDDPELTDILKEYLKSEGLQYIFKSKVIKLESGNGSLNVTIESQATSQKIGIEGDAILLSVGRKPNIEGLDLEAAGVAYDKRGIVVDDHCRTSMKNIYACGDVAGRFQFTHFAEHMAKIAVSNALLHFPMSLDSKHITWCTYTDPELAHVGMTEEELKEKGISYEVYRFPFSRIDRAITENETTGWIKVFAKKVSGKIYGVNILGASAGEMIGEYALAMRNGISLKKIADTIHPYPTYVLGNRRAADQWYVRKQSRAFVWMLQKLFGYHGSLPDTSDPNRIL